MRVGVKSAFNILILPFACLSFHTEACDGPYTLLAGERVLRVDRATIILEPPTRKIELLVAPTVGQLAEKFVFREGEKPRIDAIQRECRAAKQAESWDRELEAMAQGARFWEEVSIARQTDYLSGKDPGMLEQAKTAAMRHRQVLEQAENVALRYQRKKEGQYYRWLADSYLENGKRLADLHEIPWEPITIEMEENVRFDGIRFINEGPLRGLLTEVEKMEEGKPYLLAYIPHSLPFIGDMGGKAFKFEDKVGVSHRFLFRFELDSDTGHEIDHIVVEAAETKGVRSSFYGHAWAFRPCL